MKQFLIQRAIKEASCSARDVTGMCPNNDGHMIANSARIVGESVRGLTADRIKEKLHPDWTEQYPDFVREWKEKNRLE